MRDHRSYFIPLIVKHHWDINVARTVCISNHRTSPRAFSSSWLDNGRAWTRNTSALSLETKWRGIALWVMLVIVVCPATTTLSQAYIKALLYSRRVERGRKEGGGGQVKSLVDTAIAFSNLVSQYRRFPNGTKVLVASRAPVEGSWIRRLSLTYFQGYLITKTKCFHARQAFGV